MAQTRTAYRPSYEATRADDSGHAAKWLLGFLSVLVFGFAFCALLFFQISSAGPAKGSLRSATAALTEIDTLLASHYDDLQVQAEASGPGDTMQLEDFPIAIGLKKEDVLGTPQAELQAIILDRAADRLYAVGTSALRDSAANKGSLGMFSVAGFTDRMLGQLTADKHTLFAILAAVLFMMAAALLMATAMACTGWGRLTAAGVIVTLTGVSSTVVALFAKLYTDSQAGDASEYLRGELFGILSNHASLALRNGIAFAIAGAFLVAIASIGATLAERSVDSTRST